MGERTEISWTDSTFNCWVGCTKVSPGCDHCYAEAMMDHRYGRVQWGPHGERQRTKTWGDPLRWQRQAAAFETEHGHRHRVFCASLADVFDNQVPEEWRADLWNLIRKCDRLDWQLLTKRPQNIKKMLPPDWGSGWPHVWLGTTTENQEEADRRVQCLLAVPAAVRFLSCEPLLGMISLYIAHAQWATSPRNLKSEAEVVDWVICGGESGPYRRPMELAWARSIRDQCSTGKIPFFMKQIDKVQPIPADLMIRQFPRPQQNEGVR